MLGMKKAGASGARQIKEWAREVFAIGEEATIMVSELRCSEPGCPPVETVIAILDGPGEARQYKIHQPSAAVTRSDVAALAAGKDGTP
jgi:hypothetical protein